MELGAAVRDAGRIGCPVCGGSLLFVKLMTQLHSFVEDRTYKLLIVDSIMNLFRESIPCFGLNLKCVQVKITLAEANFPSASRSARVSLLMGLADLSQKLNQFLSRLQKIAEEFNIAILLTNQVQADPGVRKTFCKHATLILQYAGCCHVSDSSWVEAELRFLGLRPPRAQNRSVDISLPMREVEGA